MRGQERFFGPLSPIAQRRLISRALTGQDAAALGEQGFPGRGCSSGRAISGEGNMSTSGRNFSGVSSEAVLAATGRGWDEWVEFLDGLGARDMTHKEIAALAAGPGGLSNGWWQQSVTVGYEQARGLRVVGQSSGTDFQIGVQKTLPVIADVAWGLLADEPGRTAWLGKTEALEFRKGEEYLTAEGHRGEIRSCVQGERIRLTWSHPGLARPSTLEIYLAPSGNKTSVRFHQGRLSSLEERELMRSHWRGVLDDLGRLV